MQYIRKIKLKEDIEINEQYPFTTPCIKNFQELSFNKPVTFIVGENGSGKSTLIEAIAVALGFNAEGGTKNFNFSTNQTHSNFYQYLKVIKNPIKWRDGFFLRAESFYNVATNIDELDEGTGGIINYYGGKSLHTMSHGESFIALVKNRFGGNGIYILDEPEAALSPSRQLSLLCLIHKLVQKNSQFIIATHSPILLGYPDSEIYQVDETIEKIKYEETEHYFLTKYFLNNPDNVLKELFK